VTLERAGTNFRALQVLEDADSASLALGSAAKALDVMSVIFVRAVGKVKAGDVHAEAEQIAHVGFGAAGRADGADNFRAARVRRRFLGTCLPA
jgi:hypothetical protein